jgi:hypothetical protein
MNNGNLILKIAELYDSYGSISYQYLNFVHPPKARMSMTKQIARSQCAWEDAYASTMDCFGTK